MDESTNQRESEMDEYDDFGYEPYEDDLQEFSDREAWEDAQAEMREDWDEDEDGEYDGYDAEAEAERRAEYAMEAALGFGE